MIGLALAVRRTGPAGPRELAVLATLPPAVLMAVSFVTSSLWVPRYVLFVVPVVCLLAAAALRGLRLRALVALVLLAGWPSRPSVGARTDESHGCGFPRRRGDHRARATARRRDRLRHRGTWSLRAGIDYQLRGKHEPRDVLLTTPAAEVGELDAVQCADPVACLGPSPRVWFFRQWQTGEPLSNAGSLAETLTGDYRQLQVWHATKATLVLLDRR